MCKYSQHIQKYVCEIVNINYLILLELLETPKASVTTTQYLNKYGTGVKVAKAEKIYQMA